MLKQIKDILLEFRKIRDKGSFIQNVSIVFGGNAINLILQLIFAPIISRIYGPEAYGEYAYYNLIISNIGFIAAMSLPSVYILPKTRLEHLALGKVVLISVLLCSALALLFFLIFNGVLFDFKGTYWAIPLMIGIMLIGNLNSIFGSLNVRNKLFKKNATVEVLGNVAAKSATLGVGLAGTATGLGLMTGDLVKTTFISLTQTSWKIRLIVFRYLLKNNWSEVWCKFKDNINVPKYIFPSQLMSKWTSDLPVLIIAAYYSKEMLGYYAFASSMLNIPRNLIGNAIQPVFYQKVNELNNNDKEKIEGFISTIYGLSLGLLLIPMTLLTLYSPEIFSLFFGKEWEQAGLVAVAMGFQYILSTIATPLGGIRRVFRLERQIFILSILSIFFKLAPFLLLLGDISFINLIFVYSISNTIYLLINITNLFWSVMQKRSAIKLALISFVSISISIYIVFNYVQFS